jgi:hypothetical protein
VADLPFTRPAPFRPDSIPTSSWRLSEVERSIAALAVKKIYRGTHTSARALELDVKDWIEHWNDEPRPSVWAKTPHQILDSLARSRERVSAAPSTSSRP